MKADTLDFSKLPQYEDPTDQPVSVATITRGRCSSPAPASTSPPPVCTSSAPGSSPAG